MHCVRTPSASVLQRVVSVGSQFRFDPDDLRPFAQRPNRQRHAGDEPAAAYGRDDVGNVRQVLHDLGSHGALARHDPRMVVRRHQGCTRAICDLLGSALASVLCVGAAHHLGAQRPRVIYLELRRPVRDDDGGLDPEVPRRGGNALSVVAAGLRHHAALPHFGLHAG